MGTATAEPRVAPTIKIADDAPFPSLTGPRANGGGTASQPQVSRPQPAAVPLFPPIPPASVPPEDLPRTSSQPPVASMARTPSRAPADGMRAMNQPPMSMGYSAQPAAMPRSISQAPPSVSVPPLAPARASQPAVAPSGQGSQPGRGGVPGSPPAGSRAVQPAPAARPSAQKVARPSAPSVRDEPIPRSGRRWGLIVMLVILDLGLAGSGGFMLWRGLATPAPATTQSKVP